jgi:hypothetical protein
MILSTEGGRGDDLSEAAKAEGKMREEKGKERDSYHHRGDQIRIK